MSFDYSLTHAVCSHWVNTGRWRHLYWVIVATQIAEVLLGDMLMQQLVLGRILITDQQCDVVQHSRGGDDWKDVINAESHPIL